MFLRFASSDIQVIRFRRVHDRNIVVIFWGKSSAKSMLPQCHCKLNHVIHGTKALRITACGKRIVILETMAGTCAPRPRVGRSNVIINRIITRACLGLDAYERII